MGAFTVLQKLFPFFVDYSASSFKATIHQYSSSAFRVSSLGINLQMKFPTASKV